MRSCGLITIIVVEPEESRGIAFAVRRAIEAKETAMNWIVVLFAGLGFVALLYGAVCIVLARLMTGPGWETRAPLRATPAIVGLHYEDVLFSATDGLRISGWWLPATATTAILMIPGGGQNRLNDNSDLEHVTMDNLEFAQTFVALGHGVLMYDPRATGASDGNRVSYGSLESRDVIGALDWLAARGMQSDHVVVMAWSMGCASAMFALEKRTYAGLIADSPLGGFSVDDIVKYAARLLKVPIAVARPVTTLFMHGVFFAARLMWGMRLSRQPVGVLREHPIPTLVIHGREDETIPLRVAEQVADAVGEKLVGAHYLDGVGHCRAYETDRDWYVGTVMAALDRMLPSAVRPGEARVTPA